MGDNEQNATNQVDDQETEAERSEAQTAAARRRQVEQGSTSVSAPVDDDVIIK